MAAELTEAKRRPQVLIAGGGVAGVEALLCLRALAGPWPEIELLSPDPDLAYRPLRVTEPFELGEVRRFPLQDIASDQLAAFRPGALISVDVEARVAHTRSGEELAYDHLLLATGARTRNALPGALTFHGRAGADDVAAALDALRDGRVRHLAFAVPDGVSWPLPLYELALLAAWELEREGVGGVDLEFVTPERRPLEVFGAEAGSRVEALLETRGIGLRTGARPMQARDGRLLLDGGGSVAAEWTIAAPALEGRRTIGIPADEGGFVPIDEHGRVRGIEGVYAAGDGTDHPLKQGGIATQQADAAAEAIAAAVGSPHEPQPFMPVLRAALLTGSAPLYLRADIEHPDVRPDVATRALWWPPGKIAGRYLSPYLAHLERPEPELAVFEDREAPREPERPGDADDHRAAVELALTMADDEAARGERSRALEWLDAAQALEGVLPPEYVAKRREWGKVRERAAERRREEHRG
jgi:sulfide:quinone oxidoreductase